MEINKIYLGTALDVLKTFPNESINCVVTSPPYWSLRSYETPPQIWGGDKDCKHEWGEDLIKKQSGGTEKATVGNNVDERIHFEQKSNYCTKCSAWKGELGLEPLFYEYISHLCDIFEEVKRILKPGGTCWVNIADTYYSLSGGKFLNDQLGGKDKNELTGLSAGNQLKTAKELEQKNLCNIPARFSIEMQRRGWILRNEIIWHKPSCMPSSIKDRFTVDFEKIFFFVKNKKYYFEQQFEPLANTTIPRMLRGVSEKNKWANGPDGQTKHTMSQPRANMTKYYVENYGGSGSGFKGHSGYLKADGSLLVNPKGRNMRTVWKINTKPFKGSHFAVFPEKLVETPIRAGCPEFICTKCGKAREKIFRLGEVISSGGSNDGKRSNNKENFQIARIKCKSMTQREHIEKGYTDCGCGFKSEAGIVLDPFCGSGTTAVVALKNNRNFIGIELNEKYIEIANKRLKPFLEQKRLC